MSGYVPNPPKNYRYEEAKPVDIHAQRWAEYEKHGKEPAPAPQKIEPYASACSSMAPATMPTTPRQVCFVVPITP